MQDAALIVQYKAIFLAGWFVLFFALERLRPAARAAQAGKGARLARNFGLWGIVLAASPLLVLPIAAFGAGLHVWARPDWLAGAAGVVLSLVILDLWTYFLHRAYHEVPAMWRLHLPHHLDGHLDATSAIRFHLLEVVLSAALRILPIALFAIPFAHVVLFEIILLASAIFHHSNVRLPAAVENRLSAVIVTPSIHWVHHHAVRRDTDSNYCAVLSIWDRLFGTFSPTRRSPDMKIGVEGAEEKTFVGLLLTPFSR